MDFRYPYIVIIHRNERGWIALQDKKKFDADWDLVNKLDKMAIDYLKDGFSPKETQGLILNSELFKEWKSTERCFDVHYHDILRFEDLSSSLEFDNYVNMLKSIAFRKMEDKANSFEIESNTIYNGPTVHDTNSGRVYDRLFYQIGISISPFELGIEMGKFCKSMNFSEPIGLLEFLALFTNNASGLLNLGLEKLQELSDKQFIIEEFKNKYILKYKK
ncbi:hypothetical protein ICC18_20120 [Paenibacillus sp. WST5]|uniref:Uncharacterized protein n=1 Tax=Paenibacillus sedimenti TaxID=2770274 RepID=A0A926KQY0_9BACL|nr:hypothetical protein [Paenibacillus sedimenti]